MIINQSGVSSPFVFAGTGDHLYVRGSITNIGTTATSVISSALAGNKINVGGLVASFGTGDAISMFGGGTIINNGLISGAVTTDAVLNLTNAGRLVGFVVSSQAGAGAGSTIVNKGSMVLAETVGATAHVAGAVITLGAGNDSVVNTGAILGDVWLGEGNNVFDSRVGTMVGTVNGGSGDDVYLLGGALTILDAGGMDTVNVRGSFTLGTGFENLVLSGFGNFYGTGNTVANGMTGNSSNNLMDGLGGNDTLLGGGGADTLLGGTNNDSLDGQNGDDLVDGSYGNDVAAGGDGLDTVLGGNGSDLMSGGNGADVLDGGIGADTMDGGDGADRLIGGAFGTDVMTGGAGADTFVYLSANDSFATAAADRITDFEVGVDLIDLSALTAGTFDFVGSGAFSLTQESVRVVTGASTTTVMIDLNFDGVADMQVILTGVLALTGADFAL